MSNGKPTPHDVGTGKPTPTQEENDRAAMGEHVTEHEPDGSPPDTGVHPPEAEPKRREQRTGDYQTRDMRSGPHPQPAPHTRPGPKHDDK